MSKIIPDPEATKASLRKHEKALYVVELVIAVLLVGNGIAFATDGMSYEEAQQQAKEQAISGDLAGAVETMWPYLTDEERAEECAKMDDLDLEGVLAMQMLGAEEIGEFMVDVCD